MRRTKLIAKKENRRNEAITAPEVRVVSANSEQLGIMKIEDALRAAEDAGLELVEIAPNAEPPVCRIMDYGKHQFQKSKMAQDARKKQKQVQVKEIKFRPRTDIGDYNTKLRKLRGFLENGDRTKVTMRFRGREFAHQELGLKLLKRVEADLDELAAVEVFPKMEGRQMIMVLAPKKDAAV